MGLENVKYDAFISYRHCDLDKFNAMTIQKKLENFKLPKSLYGKTVNGKTRIDRVFRDQDELPLASNLSDPIETALQNSEFLIVICTPRLPESQWCAKEMETFISLHGRERVLAVLAEGEPEQSFPEALRYVNRVVLDEQGNPHEIRQEIEPLAADSRGESRGTIKKKIDDVILRLAAPIFGLNYDDLKQRHKEQRTKKIITIASGIASVFFVFAMVCLLLAFRINSQKNTIEDQYNEIENKNREIEANYYEIAAKNDEITAQNREITAKNEEITAKSEELAAKNEEITAQNEEINRQYRAEQVKYAESMADVSKKLLTEGRQKDALYVIRNAMPDSLSDTDVSYTAAAERALSDALGIYDSEKTLVPSNVYNMDAEPLMMSLSYDDTYLLTTDSSNCIYLFSTKDGELNKKIEASELTCDPKWIDDDTIIFLDGRKLSIYTVGDEEPGIIAEGCRLFTDDAANGKLYSFEYDEALYGYFLRAYSAEGRNKKLFEVPIQQDNDEYIIGKKLLKSFGGEYVSVLTGRFLDFGISGKNSYTLSVISTKSKKVIMEKELELDTIADMDMTEDSVVLLTLENAPDAAFHVIGELLVFDAESGEIKWQKTYGDNGYNSVEFYHADIPVLILDGLGNMMIYDAETGADVSYQTYFGNKVNSFILPTYSGYSRVIITDDGSILSYVSQNNLVFDFTRAYYKYLPERKVNLVEYDMGSYLFNYENDNCIVQFDLALNRYKNEKYFKDDIEIDGSGLAEYRDDYRYLICTSEVYNSDGTGSYEHSLIDVANGEVVCTVSDSSRCAVFSPVRDDRFITYSKTLTEYDFDGNVTNSKSYEDYFYELRLSEDGKGFILKNNSLDAVGIVSADTFEEEALLSDIDYRAEISIAFNSKLAAVLNNGVVSIYEFGSPEAVKNVDFDSKLLYSLHLSSDGKYLFLNYSNDKIEVYTVDDFRKVTSFFNLGAKFTSVEYISSLDSYLVKGEYDMNMLMNKDIEIVRDIPYGEAYDSVDGCFIAADYDYFCRIPYFSYDELIDMADGILGDYEPSDSLKAKFHV